MAREKELKWIEYRNETEPSMGKYRIRKILGMKPSRKSTIYLCNCNRLFLILARMGTRGPRKESLYAKEILDTYDL